MAAVPGLAEASSWPLWRGEIDHVTAYLYDFTRSEGGELTIVVASGSEQQLHPAVAVEADLSREQIDRLIRALNSNQHNQAAECFLPHHGFVFYNADDQVVAHVSVCFLCGTGVTAPGGPKASRWDMREMRSILAELKVPVHNSPTRYRKYFNAIFGQNERRPRAKGGK